MAKLRLYGLIRAAAGKGEIEAKGSKVIEALHAALDPLAEVRPLVFDEDGNIYPMIRVLIGNSRVTDLNSRIDPDTIIHLIPVVEGG